MAVAHAGEGRVKREIRRTSEAIVSRLAAGVLESGKRKAPCICAGECTESGSDAACQECEHFMGYYHMALEKSIIPEENSGIHQVTARGLASHSADELISVATSSGVRACDAARGAGDSVAAKCARKEWLSKVGCFGGLQQILLTRNLLPSSEDIDSAQLNKLTKQFLNKLLRSTGQRGSLGAKLNAAANAMGAPSYLPARKIFNTLLCETAGVPLKDCGYAKPAMFRDASHRARPALAYLYEQIETVLRRGARDLGMSEGRQLEAVDAGKVAVAVVALPFLAIGKCVEGLTSGGGARWTSNMGAMGAFGGSTNDARRYHAHALSLGINAPRW